MPLYLIRVFLKYLFFKCGNLVFLSPGFFLKEPGKNKADANE